MKKTALFFFYIFYTTFITPNQDVIDAHVICYFTSQPKNKKERADWNKKMHQATYDINQYCKKNYNHPYKNNLVYPHRKDSVFLVDCDDTQNYWTLYKPSFIPFQEFILIAQKIYADAGLSVQFLHDELVTIAQFDTGFDATVISLSEFEMYKKMTDEDFEKKISDLQNDESANKEVIKKLRQAQAMKKLFFWHLQTPTTGLLPSTDEHITIKPIAWNFLLWDLAPHQGAGVKVAVIDTGISAFNFKEKNLTSLYKKHINVTMPTAVMQDYGYNLVSENGLDPIKQIAINFEHFCDHEKFNGDQLMRDLPEMIMFFVKTKDKLQFEQYFTKNAKKEFLNESKDKLNKKGDDKLKDLLYGKYGVVPSENQNFFTVVNIDKPYSQEGLLEILPVPQLIKEGTSLAAGHGTFTQALISGQQYDNQGIFGIAPQAQVIMIKAFKDDGTTSKIKLNAALQRAITLQASIVNMSLKITDSLDQVKDIFLQELIDCIDYVVAASGNDGQNKDLKEAYPARFDSVAFDVGAFSHKNNYEICPFTQKESEIGPKIVAPGFDIFSAGLSPEQKEDSMFMFMAGTSVATPIISGFIALVLAEFGSTFSREQILQVLYAFSLQLDAAWNNQTLLGTIDIRSALLCLHTLAYIKKTFDKKNINFEKYFHRLVRAIYTINYYTTEKNVPYFFTHTQTQTVEKNTTLPTTIIPEINTIKSAQKYMTKIILQGLQNKNINTDLETQVQKIMHTNNYSLFSQLPSSTQKRIQYAIAPRVMRTQPEI
jgi:subtilisin family serine protease